MNQINLQRIGHVGLSDKAATAVTATATFITWTSPTLPLLQSNNSPIGVTVTDEEGSWIASILNISVVPSALMGGWYVETIGRKGSLMLCSIIIVIPWIISYFATSVWELLVARVIAGYSLGLVTIACAIYIGEIADADIRGKLGTLFNVLKIVGSIIVLTAGPFVSYFNLILICASLPIIFMGLAFFIPESPFFYMRKGKIEECKASIKILAAKNATDSFIEKRFIDIQTIVTNDMQNKTTLYEFLTNKKYRKVIFIMTGIKTLQQMSGAAAVEAYMQSIIEDTGSNLTPELSSIVFGVVQFPAALIASAIVDKAGRKPLLIISAIGCAIGLIGEGLYFFLQDYIVHEHIHTLAWLPTSGIAIFIVMSPIGVYTLPYVLLGEMFPTNIKGIAVSAATMYGGVLAFIASVMFTPVSNAVGTYTVFWIYAGFCIGGAIFVFYFLPETKGKTFDEIQDKINNKSTKSNRRCGKVSCFK